MFEWPGIAAAALAARKRTIRMKARRDTLRKATALHAEFYHQQKIAALREEGDRLREELRLNGIDPADVLVEADLERTRQRPGNK